MILNYVPRVTQLDALQLDSQVEELFKQLLFQSTKYLKPGLLEPYLPEIELLLRTWIFKYSIYNKKSTFGQDILSCNYKTDNFSNSKLYWYFGYTVGLRYLKDRALYSFTSNMKIQNFLHKLEMFQLIGDILNFLRFIQSGKYPMLIDFILGLELTAEKLTREDLTDFSWTRELLWHNFIELIGTVISLMNIFGLKRKLTHILKYVWWKEHTHRKGKMTAAVMTAQTVCASCSSNPVLPHTMGCSHIFCYYCLMLDALQLDSQVEELFKQLLFQSTKYLKPGLLEPYLPEIELLLRTWIFKYSIYNKKSTFGQDILSCNYKTDNFSNSKLYWYFGYTVGLRYLKDRALYSFTSNMKIQNFLHKLEMFQLIGDILNFLRFIQSGKYPMLIDFILGLELTAEKLTREDLTDFSWTRELLWHNFIELIGTVISLMNIFGLKRKLTHILKYVWWKEHTHRKGKMTAAVMTAQTVCASCSSNPVLPHTMGCSHIFCYYCLMANKTADQDYACPKCYYNGKDIKRFTII